MFGRKTTMISPEKALSGRSTKIPVPDKHHVLGTPLEGPWPENMQTAVFAMGCFWGAEKIFWDISGVYSTYVGYAGGYSPNPSYEEVCTGHTGHTEVAAVIYDPAVVSYETSLKAFWENHDPTQGMRQGGDVGTQYRSAIYTTSDEQHELALASRDRYQAALNAKGYDKITTEIEPAGDFYYAEEYHQQYLSKNPRGYCNHGFCQVAYDA